MADLYHLLEELDAPQAEAEQGINENDYVEEESAVDNEPEDREVLDLPPALIQAAKERQKNISPDTETDRLDLQDFAARNDLDGRQEYNQVKHWWVQELQAPEILPWNGDTIPALIQSAFSEEGEQMDGSNLEAILSDIRRVDKERVQFVVANLLQTRLQKLEVFPWFYKQNTQILSKAEALFLKDYLKLLESHLETTVTNHFPQEAWRRLDEPEMIEQPDTDQYVVVKVIQDSTLRKETPNPRPLDEGTTVFVCYREIRNLLESGAVELLM